MSTLLLEGWNYRETIELTTADASIAFSAADEPIETGTSLDEYVAAYRERLAAELPGYESMSLQEALVMGGRPGAISEFSWTPNGAGSAVLQIQAYTVDQGRGYVATASCRADSSPEAAEVMRNLVETTDIQPSRYELGVIEHESPTRGAAARYEWHGPVVNNDVDSESTSSSPATDWLSARASWTANAVSVAGEEPPHRLSADELTVLAQHHEVEEFPGVGDASFHGYSFEAQMVAARAARRGLVARGLVTVTGDGKVSLEPDLDSLIGQAVTADLAVSIEISAGEVVETQLYLVGAETMIVHRVTENAAHEIRREPTADLLLQMLGSSADSTAGDGPTIRLAMGELSTMGDAETGAPGHPLAGIPNDAKMTLVTSTYLEGDEVRGGWLAWFDKPEAGLWLLDPVDSDSTPTAESVVDLSPIAIDQLRAKLLEYLPGE